MQVQDIRPGRVYVTRVTASYPLRVRVTRVWSPEDDGRMVVGYASLSGPKTSGRLPQDAFADVYLPEDSRYAVEMECGHTRHQEFPPMSLRAVCRECADVVSSMRIVTAYTDLLMDRRVILQTAA